MQTNQLNLRALTLHCLCDLPVALSILVLRRDIDAMEPLKLSRRPAGFESALKPQDMADLWRWLQAP